MNDDLQDALEHTSELPLYFDFSPQRVDIHRKDYDRLLLIREELLRRINEENAERVELTESCVVDLLGFNRGGRGIFSRRAGEHLLVLKLYPGEGWSLFVLESRYIDNVDEAACIANNPLLCDVLRAIEMGERRDVSDKPKNDSESP